MIHYRDDRFRFLTGKHHNGTLEVYYRSRTLEVHECITPARAQRVMFSAFEHCEDIASCRADPELWIKRIAYARH